MRIHETLLGLLFMALAAAVFAYTFTFPALPGQNVGPSLFPRVIAVGIFVCGLVMAVRGWRSGRALVSVDADLRSPRGLISFALVPLAIVFYIVAAPRLGFLPVAAIIVAVLSAWMGARVWVALVTGVVSAFVIHWFFASVMRIPLPRGWFMSLVSGA
jgi:putative tricarboxylic transport membrane protein